MKLSPINILLDANFLPNKKFYFISGNETTLMQKISSIIVESCKKNENVTLKNIESLDNFTDGGDLFEEKKLFLGKNCRGISEESMANLEGINGKFIFIQENSQKIKKIKNFFSKSEDSYLIDCYELDKNSKIKILNQFLSINKIKIDHHVYWLLIERLDNRFVFLESVLTKISELEKREINMDNIKKILTIDDVGKERVFFSLLKKNKDIVEVYKEKIITTSDVNELYYYSKYFCQLIIDSRDEEEYRKKIPLYLFKEKNFLIDIYKKYNSKKKKILLDLLSYSEKVLRKQSEISLVYGLRFILSVKKITVS